VFSFFTPVVLYLTHVVVVLYLTHVVVVLMMQWLTAVYRCNG